MTECGILAFNKSEAKHLICQQHYEMLDCFWAIVYVERLMATKTMKCLLRLSLFTHRNLPIQLVRSHRRSCSNKSDDSVRIVFISDTHSYHHQLPSLPHGDILIHAGMLDLILCISNFLLHFSPYLHYLFSDFFHFQTNFRRFHRAEAAKSRGVQGLHGLVLQSAPQA